MKLPKWGKRVAGQALLAAVLALILGAFSFPVFWMFASSVKEPSELFAPCPKLVPSRLYLDHFQYLFHETGFPTYLLNSIIVSVCSSLLCTAVACLAAYACSRLHFKGRYFFLIMLLSVQLFPLTLCVIPIFLGAKGIGMLDKRLSLVLVYTVIAMPFCIMLMKEYFDSIPKELEEAALIDGASRLTALRKVVAPLAAPGLVVTLLYSFIFSWQEFIFALTLMRSASRWTLSIGLSAFLGQYGTQWGALMAGAVIYTIPVIVIFLPLQRRFIAFLTAGGVK